MYEYYSKEKLIEMYPILETKADVLINFISCDGVMSYKLGAVLGDLNPTTKYKLQNSCIAGTVGRSKIMITKKVYQLTEHFPIIVHIPIKEDWKSPIDKDYVREAFERLESAYSLSKIPFNENSKIAIQKGIVPDDILMEALKGLKMPEVLLYDEVDYYGKLEKIKEEREAAEKAEAIRIKEEEKIRKAEEKAAKKKEKELKK